MALVFCLFLRSSLSNYCKARFIHHIWCPPNQAIFVEILFHVMSYGDGVSQGLPHEAPGRCEKWDGTVGRKGKSGHTLTVTWKKQAEAWHCVSLAWNSRFCRSCSFSVRQKAWQKQLKEEFVMAHHVWNIVPVHLCLVVMKTEGWGNCWRWIHSQEVGADEWCAFYSLLSISLGTSAQQWCFSHAGWAFPTQLNISENILMDTCRGVFPWWSYIQSSWQWRQTIPATTQAIPLPWYKSRQLKLSTAGQCLSKHDSCSIVHYAINLLCHN